MAFNQLIADRISFLFHQRGVEVEAKKMFGGITFLFKTKMTVGVMKDQLTVRLLQPKMDKALEFPYVSTMKFTGKPLKEFILVDEEGFSSDFELEKWIDLGIEHAESKIA
ncbi:MAG: TfoX/Sxy family protein [Flavobacteriales bacterium]